jgi:Tfp pilus assembly protein PilW
MSISNQAGQRAAGFTLVEMWISLALSTLLALVVVSFTMYTGKSFAGLSNYVDLESSSQQALDEMSRDIRQTKYLLSITTNELVFRDWDYIPLTFTYSPQSKTLVRTKGGVKKVLLTECDFLCFSNYQRNPISGTYDQYPVSTSPTNTKLVSLTWICSRRVTGTKLNTESVQTAKIVIRKE